MDLEKYLRDNYKTVEQLDGGGYYCEDSHHNALYIPADYDGDMKMLSYLPGDGGYPDGRMLRELIHGDNPPDYICCISHTAYHETAENLLTQTYDKLSSDLGMNINTVCQMGFSASGGNSFISMNNLLKEHPELTTYMVINNTSNDKHQVEQPENYQAIIENGTTIIYVDPPNNGYRDDRVITGLKGKYNMYILETRYDRRVGWEDFHCACNNDIQYNRMVDYLFGYTDEYGNWSPYLNCGVNYKLISYNPETKEQLEMNIEDLVSSALNGVRIPNLKKLLNVDNFTILDTLVKTD